MQPVEVLNQVLGNSIKIKLLRQLVLGYEGKTGRGLAQMISVSSPAVLGPLRELAKQGIVIQRIAGRSHTYFLNRENILVARGLLPLFQLESGLVNELGTRIKNDLPKGVESAIWYGSAAQGTSEAQSDWDILLLCSDPRSAQKISNQLPEKSAEWGAPFSTPIDAKAMSTGEFRKKFRAGDPFAQNVYRDYLNSRVPNPLFGRSLTEILGK